MSYSRFLLVAVASLSTVSCALAQTAGSAPQRTAPAPNSSLKGVCATPKSPDLHSRIDSALQRNALDGFAGTVTFTKEMWFSPRANAQLPTPADETGYVRQKWEIATDARGSLRAKITLLDGSREGDPIFVGESPTRMWMAMGHELLVCDRSATGELTGESSTESDFMRQLLEQARTELEDTLAAGGYTAGNRGREVLSAECATAHPQAVVRIEGKARSFTFLTIGDVLLPATVTSDDGQHSWRWTFSDYYQVGTRWVPRTVELLGSSVNEASTSDLYSDIMVVPTSTQRAFQRRFDPPQHGDTEFDHVLIVRSVSKQGATISDFRSEAPPSDTE